MSEGPNRFRKWFSKIPFGALLFVSSVLLYIALSPLIYVYGLIRCCEVWIDWRKLGKDVLLISLSTSDASEWAARLAPLVGARAVVLDWNERKNWDPRSLSVQLFSVFGPHGMPKEFTALSLPAVIVFRPLRRPKVFTFGAQSKDLEEKLEKLRHVLN